MTQDTNLSSNIAKRKGELIGDAWMSGDIVKPMMAPRWKFWMARLFGDKRIGRDDFCVTVIYVWRGKNYVWSITP